MAFLFKGKRIPEGVDPARIPPGQTLTAPDRWPLLHFGPVPKTDIATWNFKVFGAVENELTLDYVSLRALPSSAVSVGAAKVNSEKPPAAAMALAALWDSSPAFARSANVPP